MLETVRFRGEHGVELARSIIQALHSHGIPPTPRNYELWTVYELGILSDLTREITNLTSRGERLTEATTDALYERYIGSTSLSSEVMEATDTMASELAEALTSLRSAAKNAGDYNSELRSVTSEIEAGIDATCLKRIVIQLTSATTNMLEHNAALEKRMEDSGSHIAALQETLQAVRLEALTDALTGLANRKQLDEALHRHCLHAAKSHQPLSLVLCDIDHFKRINDAFGHPVGDSVIRFVAGVLKRGATGSALAARYGGEEFAIVLPDTSLHAAVEWSERARQTVRAQKPTRKSTGESLGTVSISLGVAQLRSSETVAAFVERTDSYLYQAKRDGRDRVVSAPCPQAA